MQRSTRQHGRPYDVRLRGNLSGRLGTSLKAINEFSISAGHRPDGMFFCLDQQRLPYLLSIMIDVKDIEWIWYEDIILFSNEQIVVFVDTGIVFVADEISG